MIDLQQLRQWIGREEQQSETVTEALAARFNSTFELTDPVRAGDCAGLLIHFCLATVPAPTAALGPDGHPARGGFLPPVPLPRRMWAGGALSLHDDIRVGETVTRQSRVSDVQQKAGRSGLLCFVTVTHRIESEGRLVLEERQDIVYRDAEAPASNSARAPASAAAPGTHRVLMRPSAPLLFRYSALTFNAHRIHYDAPYSSQEEGYPGLIVHGPLQATLLAQFAAKLRGKRPARFEFRSLSPLFDTADFTVNATEEEGGLRLWTSYVDGPVAMEAHAQW